MWLSSVAQETMICHDLLVRYYTFPLDIYFRAFSIFPFRSHGPFPRAPFCSLCGFAVSFIISPLVLFVNPQLATVRPLNFVLPSSSAFDGLHPICP